MIRITIMLICIIFLISSPATTQSKTLFVGGVELRLGMSREATMKALTPKYDVSALGETSFIIKKYDQEKKLWNFLGSIGFENNSLSFISRSYDTEAWPGDMSYSAARSIYDAINAAISKTDDDGAKRTNAAVVIDNQDISEPSPGSMRTIDLYIDNKKVSIILSDDSDGKRVSASVSIRSKPW